MRNIAIAYGKNLINSLDNEDFETAVKDIQCQNGDIIEFNPLKDDIEELFRHIRGSVNFRQVTIEELNQINNLLNK